MALVLHASTVAFAQGAIVIRGASASGKSTLALQLMGLGAMLVSDDKTSLSASDGRLWAARPPNLPAAVEMRGLGLLRADVTEEPAAVSLIVDLDIAENARLPAPSEETVLNVRVPRLQKIDSPAFPVAIRQYVRRGLL